MQVQSPSDSLDNGLNPAPSPPKRGRRQGPTRTRETVLQAARRCFAQLGYEKATLRRIAAAAGVDPSLVLQFFTSKEQLFRTALELPSFPPGLQQPEPPGTPHALGARVVRAYLQMWESPETRDAVMALILSAGTRVDALDAVRPSLGIHFLDPIIAGIRPDTRHLRVALAMSQLAGLAYIRYVMKVGPLSTMSLDELVTLVSPVVEHYLAEDINPGPHQPSVPLPTQGGGMPDG